MTSKNALTRREFDLVMQRAAELAALEPDAKERGFTDVDVLHIGREVGLSERHVRQALTEVRTGGPRSGGGSALRQLFGKGAVWAGRLIDRPRKEIVEELDNFLVAGQLLQAVRRKDDLLQYRPAVDWVSRVARAASSTSRQHYVAAARLVEVRLDEVEGEGTQVDIHVDPGIIGDFQAGAVMGGGLAGLGAGAGAGVVIAMAGPLALAVAGGVIVGSACTVIVAALAGRGCQRRLGWVQSEVEGILDGLEGGDGLEPPPPAWRRWVRRHFHGVARDIMGQDEG